MNEMTIERANEVAMEVNRWEALGISADEEAQSALRCICRGTRSGRFLDVS
jgi:hypothetical protein